MLMFIVLVISVCNGRRNDVGDQKKVNNVGNIVGDQKKVNDVGNIDGDQKKPNDVGKCGICCIFWSCKPRTNKDAVSSQP